VSLGFISDLAVEAEVTVRTLAAGPVTLFSATCDDPAVHIELPEAPITASQPGCLRIRVPAPVPTGPYHHTLWIDTTSADVPRLRVSLHGEADTRLTCDKREVTFDCVPLGDVIERQVRVHCAPGVEISSVRSSRDAVAITGVERSEHNTLVTVRSASHLPLGSFDGHIVFEVGGRWVRLPYRGQVVERRATSISAQVGRAESDAGPAAPAANK
jgi:hypothetical protein